MVKPVTPTPPHNQIPMALGEQITKIFSSLQSRLEQLEKAQKELIQECEEENESDYKNNHPMKK